MLRASFSWSPGRERDGGSCDVHEHLSSPVHTGPWQPREAFFLGKSTPRPTFAYNLCPTHVEAVKVVCKVLLDVDGDVGAL